MKTKFISAAVLCGALAIGIDLYNNQSSSNASGAPAGYSGSPADGHNCTSCHAGSASTQAGLITSNIPSSGYIPGTTYTVTASVTGSGSKYGFQISPQSASGTRVGTMATGGSGDMQLLSASKYITHTSSGTTGSGGRTWTFTWTAPSTNQGPFTFYGAFNLANGNNNTSGDVIKLSTLAINADPTAGLNELTEQAPIMLYPNPVVDVLHLNSSQQVLSVSVYNLKGDLVKVVTEEVELMDLSALSPGAYFLAMELGSHTVTKKILKL